jgi:homoserine O-acetyltransferase
MLGHGESSSPSNTPNFPKVLRHQDNVNAQYLLVTQCLGFTSLDAVIGHSMGGQQAYYWAVMHSSPGSPDPSFVKAVVPICTSAKTAAINLAFLEGPIAALEASADFHGGKYRERGLSGEQGVRAFGRVYAAWLTSPAWLKKERWREMGKKSLQEFLDPAIPLFARHDANDILIVAHMWRASDVGSVAPGPVAQMDDHEQRWRAALGQIRAKVLLMPSRTDQYFRVEESEEEFQVMGKQAVWSPIETEWGHIAGGGADPEAAKFLDRQISEFLKSIE